LVPLGAIEPTLSIPKHQKMPRTFLTRLSLLLLVLAPSEAWPGPLSKFPSLFPFLGRPEESNTAITGDSAKDRKQFNDRTPYSSPQNAVHAPGKLAQGFYDKTCPDVEKIVSKAFAQIVRENPGAIGNIIRLQFHDCFVNVSISKLHSTNTI